VVEAGGAEALSQALGQAVLVAEDDPVDDARALAAQPARDRRA
jgi:hypothetical protein